MSTAATCDAAVGIVGAGPVGLTMALRLASLGVPSIVVEAEDTLVKRGSKACCIQGDVLEVLDKVGCAGPVAAEGLAWRVGHTYVGGVEISTTVYPQPCGFAPFVNLSQYRIEQILLMRLAATPPAQVLWGHRVTAVRQDPEGVTIRASTPAGPRELRFRFLVACDGVRSGLRALAGAAWTGYSHGDRFLITDLRADLPFAKERHFHYDPPFNPGRQVIMHAQPGDLWRIDWQLPPDTDVEAERRSGDLDRRIRAVIGSTAYEIDWLSTYRFHQRVVDQFRIGRVFFAGDAAHALPPYGARGMNSGIQDADNLAWKLALVERGEAGDALLDTYHTERCAAARENLRITEATIRFMVPPTPARRLGRNLLLALAPSIPALRGRVNSGRMAEPFTYNDSPIVDRAAPLAGQLAPDGVLATAGRTVRLRSLLGGTFVALYVGQDAEHARRFAEAATGPGHPVPLRPVVVLPPGRGALPAGEDRGWWPDATQVGADIEGTLRQTYAPDGQMGYLVRPDGHLAGGWPGLAAAEAPGALARALAQAMAGQPHAEVLHAVE